MGEVEGIHIGLPKYSGDNRYLADWEKEMKKDIDKIVESEIKSFIEQEKAHPKAVKYYSDSVAVREIYRSKKSFEYEMEYRDNYTLKLLKQCGLDIKSFEKTWMCICNRSSVLLGCIQDKIDGFYYDENGERVPDNHPMDLNNVTFEYKEGVLTMTDGIVTYYFYVDEHQIVYVNGENVLDLTPVPTKEDENRMIRDLMDNMRADRLNHERRMQKSLEYAKTWRDEE